MTLVRLSMRLPSQWDAVTGVGTPNYEKLAQAVKALP